MHLGHAHCDHHHVPANTKLGRAFAIAVGLNVLLVIGEAVGGWLAGSIALVADAGHNLGDVAGLLLAWGAHWLSSWTRRGRWTYGWRAFTMLAAHLNAVLLSLTIVWVSYESTKRLFSPVEIAELPVMALAVLAAGLNFLTAWLLARQGTHDLNVRGAYLHMLADAAVSVAVVLGALAIYLTGWHWLDPAISLIICCLLAWGTWRLLTESTSMLMHAAPPNIDLQEVERLLLATPQVRRVGDLHVWSVSTTEVLMSCQLVCEPLSWDEQGELLHDLHHAVEHEFGIRHATFEIRAAESAEACALESQVARNILT